jgi:hypothetical protein
MTRTAKEIIKAECGNSRNLLTPYRIKIGKISKNLAYEISYGFGIGYNKLCGLTVIEDMGDETREREDLSGCFFSMEDVKNKIEEIKKTLSR